MSKLSSMLNAALKSRVSPLVPFQSLSLLRFSTEGVASPPPQQGPPVDPFYQDSDGSSFFRDDTRLRALRFLNHMLADVLDVRLKAVQLLGELFALPGISISESFQPLVSEFLKRLTDRVAEVRVSVVEHLKSCLISDPSRPEAPLIIKALCDRLLDYNENVRKQVVAAIYDVACHSFKVIPEEIIRLGAERLRDKSLSVKTYTMERLADLYMFYCLKSIDGSASVDQLAWIPGKILRCLYDKDFRYFLLFVLSLGIR